MFYDNEAEEDAEAEEDVEEMYSHHINKIEA